MRPPPVGLLRELNRQAFWAHHRSPGLVARPPLILQSPLVLLAAGGVFGGDPGRFLAVELLDMPDTLVIRRGYRVAPGTALVGPAAEGYDILRNWQ
jgi:hypothetical protein